MKGKHEGIETETHPDYPDAGPELRYIGYWRSMDRRRTRDTAPHPADHVDPAWAQAERNMVGAYLRRGRVFYGWLGSSTCRICGLRPNGTTCMTDGVWVWPEGLIHMVEVHGVRPPQELVEVATAGR